MEHTSREPTTLRSPPLQARALLFFKRLGLRTRGNKKSSSKEATVSPITIPTHDYQRAHSSIDLRKPDISRLIGLRAEDGPNPMDTDDSSQDASTSGNSPVLRHRRYSTWESLRTAPVESTFAGRGAAELFCREQAGFGAKVKDDALGNVLAPAPLFLRSNHSLDALAQPPPSSAPESIPLSSAEPGTWTALSPAGKSGDESVVGPTTREGEHRNEDTPRPSEDSSFHNCAPMTTPLHNPSPSIPSESTSPPLLESQSQAKSQSQSRLASEAEVEASTSATVLESPSLTHQPSTSTSQPPPFRVATERGLRLSPSIITRHPMPILNLPALPPPAPTPIVTLRTRIPLRSMPSLSRHGRRSMDVEANHENATLGDSDDEDVEEGDDEEEHLDSLSIHQSDDEDDEPSSAGPSVVQGFKSAQKRRMTEDTESSIGSPITPVSPQSSNLSGPNLAEYFCSKTYTKPIPMAPGQESSASTIHPFSPTTPRAEDTHLRNTLNADPPTPGARLESKPSLYRVASRSMINLGVGSTRRTERGLARVKSRDTIRSNAPSITENTAESLEDSEESDTERIGRLLRRTSMPSFHPTSDPPPYPTFDPRPKEQRVAPREDEGRERLPPYNNALYLLASMPRKMEFSSPGIQAKDRKWRRVVCELEGTAFRVYKCPPGASGAGVLGDWWEKRVGVGDVATPTSSVHRPRKREDTFEKTSLKVGIDQPPTTPTSPSSSRGTSVPPVARQTRPRSESQSSMATQSTMTTHTPRTARRVSGASFFSPFRSSSSTRPDSRLGGAETPSRPASRALELLPVDIQSSRSSLSADSQGTHGRTTPVIQPSPAPQLRPASRLSFLPGASSRRMGEREIPKPLKSDLQRAYTLQHAESGLGNDYLKRKNVIRVRLEGEQFLLQAPDVPAVVEWIEGLHAGTNIALDLDERPMPRGPMFPRRRRRRARRSQAEDSGQQTQGTSIVPDRLA